MRKLLVVSLFALLFYPTASRGDEREKDGHWFRNVAKESGLTGVKAKDCIFTDLDGDGYLDLCLDRRRFYLSKKALEFVPHETGIDFPTTTIIPLTKEGKPDLEKAEEREYVPQYLYFADLDNDGDQDALWGVKSWWEYSDGSTWRVVPECDPDLRSTVWLNDGKGKFQRGPESAYSSGSGYGPAMALAILDYDHDGNLDLYEGREYRRYGHLDNCGIDRLFKGDGKGGFTDVTEKAGLMTVPAPGGPRSSRPSYGVTHADVNNDGWPDLLQLAYGRQWNYLWLGGDDGTFRDVGVASGFAGDAITHGEYPDWVGRPAEQPFRSNGNTFDCAVGDVDNDGDLDLFLGEIAHQWAGEASDMPSLLINQTKDGEVVFERRTVVEFLPKRAFRESRSKNYGDLHVAFADFDNDTRLDLLIGSGDYPDGQFLRLYHQQPDGSFADATEVAGFDWEGCGDLSLGDYDNDGDIDILAGRSFMRLSQKHRDQFMGGIKVNEVGLFRNDIANRTKNHWIGVRLVGRKANRSAIGARVTITAGGVTQIREIRGGAGLANHQDPPQVLFGLGKAEKIDRLTVRWPDAKVTVTEYANLSSDRYVTIDQAEGILK